MTNPFDDLRQQREERDAESKTSKDTDKAQQSALKSLKQKGYAQAIAEHGPVISEVLEQLRDAQYPGSSVKGPQERRDFEEHNSRGVSPDKKAFVNAQDWKFGPDWNLGKTTTTHKRSGTVSNYNPQVTVIVLLDSEYSPVQYYCQLSSILGILVEPSREHLIQGLLLLHTT
jgi:hypothetical protein